MVKRIIIILLLLVFVGSSTQISCTKEEDPNPTNGKTTGLFNTNLSYGKLTDQTGNIYKTISIGTQIWMAENLRTTVYNDMTPIQYAISPLYPESYCNYMNTINNDTIATYGRLYTWHVVTKGKLCPVGWHEPSKEEWEILTTYLGETIAGDKLKETGAIHWVYAGANNESGFTALPGGHKFPEGAFNYIGQFGFWWSTSEYEDGQQAWSFNMTYNESGVYQSIADKSYGFSVRCLKDK